MRGHSPTSCTPSAQFSFSAVANPCLQRPRLSDQGRLYSSVFFCIRSGFTNRKVHSCQLKPKLSFFLSARIDPTSYTHKYTP